MESLSPGFAMPLQEHQDDGDGTILAQIFGDRLPSPKQPMKETMDEERSEAMTQVMTQVRVRSSRLLEHWILFCSSVTCYFAW